MSEEKLDLPFRQVLWIMYNLCKAENIYNTHGNYNNRKQVKYWRERANGILATIGIDENTDFKNMEISFIDK